MNLKNLTCQLTRLLFIQYIITTVIMMFLYRGGNRYAPEVNHYVFDQNYLSDLGRTVGFSGVDNPNYYFYSITLGLIGVGILLFFIQLQNTMTNKAKHVMTALATVSAIGYIGIALYPVDLDIQTHITFGRMAFFSFFISTLLAQILLNKQTYKTANILFTILNIMLFSYLILLFFGPSSSLGVWALQLKTIAQKIMVYSQIILCLGILRNTLLDTDK